MELLSKLLKTMLTLGASDLFLSSNMPPAFRVNGKILPRHDEEILKKGKTEQMARLFMSEDAWKKFIETHETNLAITVPGLGRFRVNAFKERNDIAMVIRSISDAVPDFHDLSLPDILKELVMLKSGLVLIVGPAGSGKSTTLASMLNFRNQNDLSHIITIEDPIEYYLPHKQCVLHQREIGIDTHSYHEALKNAMRQSPDVLVLGEIRDRESLEAMIEYADTGHLCLATYHAANTYQALERIIHMFDEERHEQIQNIIASNVKAIFSQRLIPDKRGGRTPAFELLRSTSRTAELIRRGTLSDLHEVMEKDVNGMYTMDQTLFHLQQAGRITPETAVEYAESVGNMRLQLRLSQEAEIKQNFTTS